MYTSSQFTEWKEQMIDGLNTLLALDDIAADYCTFFAKTSKPICSETQRVYAIDKSREQLNYAFDLLYISIINLHRISLLGPCLFRLDKSATIIKGTTNLMVARAKIWETFGSRDLQHYVYYL